MTLPINTSSVTCKSVIHEMFEVSESINCETPTQSLGKFLECVCEYAVSGFNSIDLIHPLLSSVRASENIVTKEEQRED